MFSVISQSTILTMIKYMHKPLAEFGLYTSTRCKTGNAMWQASHMIAKIYRHGPDQGRFLEELSLDVDCHLSGSRKKSQMIYLEHFHFSEDWDRHVAGCVWLAAMVMYS